VPAGIDTWLEPENRPDSRYIVITAPTARMSRFRSWLYRKKPGRVERAAYGGGCDVLRGGNAKCILDMRDVGVFRQGRPRSCALVCLDGLCREWRWSKKEQQPG
jgi:hypothetical protein